MKPLGDPRSYRPISFKILERFVYTGVKPLIDPLLPREQGGFRREKLAVDQVTFLTQEIENSYSPKKKTCAVFVDFTAVYDTLWHRGLTCKLLHLLPDRHIASLLMELVQKPSFTLTTNTESQSRLRRLENGVPQGSVITPLLSNIYIHDLPVINAKKFA